jgi:hypothetical protein
MDVIDEKDISKTDASTEEATTQVKEELMKKEKEVQEKLAKGIRFVCSKHGDITNGVIYTTYRVDSKDKEGKVHSELIRRFYCVRCLDDIVESFKKQGLHGEVKIGIDKNVLKDLGITEEAFKKSQEELKNDAGEAIENSDIEASKIMDVSKENSN